MRLEDDNVTMFGAWASSHYGSEAMFGPKLAWKGESKSNSGFFHSKRENKPWLRIQLNKPVILSSVIIVNRKDCCGARLRNLELRGGMKNHLLNAVIGRFRGPGRTKGVHKIQLQYPTKVQFLSFQLMMNAGVLQINGIKLSCKKRKYHL